MRGGLARASQAAVRDAHVSPANVPVPPVDAPPRASLWAEVARGVEFTPAFIGLLVYIFVVTSYTVPIGDVALGFAAFALLAMNRQGYTFPRVAWWLLAFVLWTVVGYTQTEFPTVVWDRTYQTVKLGLILLIALNTIRTRAQVRFFTIFFLACYAFFPARGTFLNYFVYHGTVGGRSGWINIFGNPNDMASMTLLQLSMCAGLLFVERQKALRLLALSGVFVLTLCILTTQSRGGFVGMAVFGLAALLQANRNRRLRTLVLGAAVAAAGVMFAPSNVWTRVKGLRGVTNTNNLAAVDGSAEQRWEIWKVAVRMIREHPIHGVGLGAYPNVHGILALQPEFNPTARGNRDTHSTLLNVAAETGIPGVLLFAGIFIATVLYAERVRRALRDSYPDHAKQLLFLEFGLLAFFTAGSFGSYAKLNFPYLHVVLIWTYATTVEREILGSLALRRRTAPALPAGRRPR
jgi:O-antigen ligase